jgi:hypothetical protein
MANTNGIAGETVGQITTFLLNRFDPFVEQLNQCRTVLRALKQGEVKLEQIQLLEDGTVRVLPPAPQMTCVEEVTKMVPEIKKNGSDPKASGELVTAGNDGTD